MSATVLQFPTSFLPHEEYLIDSLLKRGYGLGPIPEKTRFHYCVLFDDGELHRIEMVFSEVEKRANAMLEAGDGYW